MGSRFCKVIDPHLSDYYFVMIEATIPTWCFFIDSYINAVIPSTITSIPPSEATSKQLAPESRRNFLHCFSGYHHWHLNLQSMSIWPSVNHLL
ncbi:hypothetical protein K443DRAFT_573847 [Laccaria amethystina LaAM-08-1]|uniref:Uncharacterized protein n=1 Tax=Laccaria amethystina LaAM-08-1 TaxID=1095629 RepID=A0A0C9XU74_9AGAR|nr:hypothetical protein K443DRAFT_573847 [Laccaria amethystina LaAM-08-1]